VGLLVKPPPVAAPAITGLPAFVSLYLKLALFALVPMLTLVIGEPVQLPLLLQNVPPLLELLRATVTALTGLAALGMLAKSCVCTVIADEQVLWVTLIGEVVNTSLPAPILKPRALLVADVRPVPAAVSLFEVPATSMLRSLKVARPEELVG
jgi:hypothetical protein